MTASRTRTVLAIAFCAVAATAAAAQVLTIADVEKVAGTTGVTIVPRDPSKGAGGDLNFATADGKLLVMIRVYENGGYEKLKKMYFAADVAGVGDEAFSAPKGVPEPYVLYFRKGSKAGSVTTYFQRDGHPRLTMAKLSGLARLIASRI